MIYHVTIRWVLIRICAPLLCYRQERASELLLPRPGLYSHSSSKACRLLTMLVCILPRVLKASSVDRPQNTINGHSEMRLVSVALLLCLCINAGGCVCNQAGLHLPVGCIPASLSYFYSARDMMLFLPGCAWLCQVRVKCSS